MNKELIIKLLQSKNYDDVRVAMELLSKWSNEEILNNLPFVQIKNTGEYEFRYIIHYPENLRFRQRMFDGNRFYISLNRRLYFYPDNYFRTV